jgi:hypothetical protein
MVYEGDAAAVEKELVLAGIEVVGPVVKMGKGWNAQVLVRIGDKQFKVTIDTGAARNFVKKQFVRDLLVDRGCADAVQGRHPGDRRIRIEGVHEGQQPSSGSIIDTVCKLTIQFLKGGY